MHPCMQRDDDVGSELNCGSSGSSVAVAMVQIGDVRMRVRHGLVAVRMRMRLDDGRVVMVLMMLVVGMEMIVFEHLVSVHMQVALAKKNCDT